MWKIPRLSLAASGVVSIPDIIRLIAQRRHIDEHDLKQVIRLHAFGRQLRRQAKSVDCDAVFFDEGVVFALAKLRADIGVANMSQAMRRWEAKMIEQWSQVLDLVVWIDAPNEVLLDRIRTRPKMHRMKDRPAAEVFEFLENYRAAYYTVLAEVKSFGKTRILQIDSGETGPDEMAGSILADRRPDFAGILAESSHSTSSAVFANE